MDAETEKTFRFDFNYLFELDGRLNLGTIPNLPFSLFYEWYKTINNKDITLDQLVSIASIGALIVRSKHQEKVTDDDFDRMLATIQAIQKRNFLPDERWQTDEDALWSFSYYVLSTQQVSYREVAEFATETLGKTISPDALRVRLLRWANVRKLPPIKKEPGRPSTRTRTK